ncbi:MAG: lysylphosphatidylglycerol synthase domain-containing protein [Candidatus Poribacteria bacterium]|nr:lysylphosphatidylglycerol synthase domain-containing protein [Candidatus Poribacteria bacterium]
MKTIRQYVGILIAGVLLFFLAKPFLQTHTSLKQITFSIQWHWLISSFCLILLYWSAYLYPFARLLSGVTQKRVNFRDAWLLFHLSNITRYLPGRIWGIIRLLSLCKEFDLSKTAVGSSLTLHVGIETFLGGILAMSLLFSHQMRGVVQGVLKKFTENAFITTAAIIVILVGSFFLIPMLSSKARRLTKTLRDIGELLLQKSFWGQWVKIIVSHMLLWMCQGFAFFLFVRSLTPVKWMLAGVLSACFAFAWFVGFLSFLTPGGLGIREGLLAILLANYMPTPQATRIALLCRVWMLAAEIALAAIAFLYNRRKQ